MSQIRNFANHGRQGTFVTCFPKDARCDRPAFPNILGSDTSRIFPKTGDKSALSFIICQNWVFVTWASPKLKKATYFAMLKITLTLTLTLP